MVEFAIRLHDATRPARAAEGWRSVNVSGVPMTRCQCHVRRRYTATSRCSRALRTACARSFVFCSASAFASFVVVAVVVVSSAELWAEAVNAHTSARAHASQVSKPICRITKNPPGFRAALRRCRSGERLS